MKMYAIIIPLEKCHYLIGVLNMNPGVGYSMYVQWVPVNIIPYVHEEYNILLSNV